MQKLWVSILLIFMAIPVHSQTEANIMYPEKYYLDRFKSAKGTDAKMNAAGILGGYYRKYCQDSLSNLMIENIYKLASSTLDPERIVRAKWWDAYIHSQAFAYDEYDYITRASERLLKYADSYHFLEYKIAAYNILSDINIHKDLSLSEKNAIAAGMWLEEIHSDSLKVEIHSRLAHVYIHTKDGINSSRHLLKMLEYAESDENQAVKTQAQLILGNLYTEIGEWKKSIIIYRKLLDYYTSTHQKYERLETEVEFVFPYWISGDKKMLSNYLNHATKLMDSMKTANFTYYWLMRFKYNMGMIKSDQYIQMLTSGFNGKYKWPPAKVYFDLSEIYLGLGQIDSAEMYFNRSIKNGLDKLAPNFVYPEVLAGTIALEKKDYKKAYAYFDKERIDYLKYSDMSGVANAYRNMMMAAKGMKDFELTVKLMEARTKITDSLEALNNEQEITLMELEKDKEINERKIADNERKAEHRHNLQYMGMALGAGAILLILLLLGLVEAKPWLIRLMSFFSFIFIFEYIILLLDGQIHHLTEGEPWMVLSIKVLLVALLYPLHHFVEERVSHHLIHKRISISKGVKRIWGKNLGATE